MSESTTRPCRACGCPIEFIMGQRGKAIPVQRVRSVYYLNGETLVKEVSRPNEPGRYVSHFETCSDPGRF